MKVSKGVDMMDFLRDNRTVLHKMFSLAGRILCIAASSTATERVFLVLVVCWKSAVRRYEPGTGKRQCEQLTISEHQYVTFHCLLKTIMTLTVADSELRF